MIKRISMIIIAACSIASCASQAPVPPPELLAESDHLITQGVAQYNQANYEQAGTLFEQALYRYRSIDNPEGIASAYINLAKTETSQHHLAAAQHWLDKAQAVIKSEHMSQLTNRIAIVASSIAIENNDFATAKARLDPLLDTAATSNNAELLTAALQNRTRIAFAESEQAAVWTTRFEKQATASGNHLAIARLNRFRAALATDSAQQNTYYTAALTSYRNLAYRPGLAATLSEWAEKDITIKNYEDAENKLARALLIRADLHDRYHCQQILKQLEVVYTATGNKLKLAQAAHWQALLVAADFADWPGMLQDLDGPMQ